MSVKPRVPPDSAHVVVYSVDWCPYCRNALSLLGSKGVDVLKVDVDGDPKTRAWLTQATGQSTVPQVFIAGQSYGGFTDIASMERRGELDPLLVAPKS